MIYTQNEQQDSDNLLQYINRATKAMGINGVRTDTDALWSVCVGMRADFPHVDGLEKASWFKKAANFVAHFLAFQPIKTPVPPSMKLGALENPNLNAIIAFGVAIECLNKSTVHREDGSFPLDNQIFLSDHSYIDIIDALSKGVTPHDHYKLLAVFFEQLTYKCNPDVEYNLRTFYPKGEKDTSDVA